MEDRSDKKECNRCQNYLNRSENFLSTTNLLETTRYLDQTTRNYDQSPKTSKANEFGISEQNSFSKPDVPRLKFGGKEKSIGSTPRMGMQTERLGSPSGPLRTEHSDNSCFYKPDLSHLGSASFMKTTARPRGSPGYLDLTETNINGFRLKKCQTTKKIIPFNNSAGRTLSPVPYTQLTLPTTYPMQISVGTGSL